MLGPFGRDRFSVQLSREADGEVADVDRFLHLAAALGDRLAGFERDQPAQLVVVRTQLFTEQTHEFAAARRGHRAPFLPTRRRAVDRRARRRRRVPPHVRERRTGDRRGDDQRAVELFGRHAERRQQLRGFFGRGRVRREVHHADTAAAATDSDQRQEVVVGSFGGEERTARRREKVAELRGFLRDEPPLRDFPAKNNSTIAHTPADVVNWIALVVPSPK